MTKKEEKLRLLDLFAGIGGFSYAGEKLGFFRTTRFVEKDAFCQKVLMKNFPDVPIDKDIKTFKGKENEYDIITFGFPCFEKDTLILTKKGFKPIEECETGELVLTHKNRWRRILSVMSSTNRKIQIIKSRGIKVFTTLEHPFLVKNINHENLSFLKAIDLLPKKHLLTIPHIPIKNKLINKDLDWIDIWHLGKNFNGLDIPFWILESPIEFQKCYLDGLLKNNIKKFIKVGNKKVALTLSFIIQNVFQTIPIFLRDKENNWIVYYDFVLTKQNFMDKNYGYCPLQQTIETTRTSVVFNLEVEEDESYIADGFCVHNCQDLSFAGKQKGFNGNRSILFYDATRIIRESKPLAFVAENVVGIKKFFEPVLEEFDQMRNFKIFWFVVSCKDVGGSHQRERWFTVGIDEERIREYRKSLSAHPNSSAEKSNRNSRRVNSGRTSTVQEKEQSRNSKTILGQRCNLLSSDENRFVADTNSKSARVEESENSGQERKDTRALQSEILRQGNWEVDSKGIRTDCLVQKKFNVERRSTEQSTGKIITEFCGTNDGIPPWLYQLELNMDQLMKNLLSPEDAHKLIAEGKAITEENIELRSKRIKALGNAVTPQQAMIPLVYAYRLIMDFQKGE